MSFKVKASPEPKETFNSGLTGKGQVQTSSTSQRLRTIKELEPGQSILGYVVQTTPYAAFLDVGVVRTGAQGKKVPVTGFLHKDDIQIPYALEKTWGVKHNACEMVVKKGMHLTAYVKDVFPNSGRLTLSLDPTLTSEKVKLKRERKRSRAHSLRRQRRAGAESLDLEVGKVVEGFVTEVTEEAMIVDVTGQRLSLLKASQVEEILGGNETIGDLRGHAKRGDSVTVRVSGFSGAEDGYAAMLEFVHWGGIFQEESH